MNDHPTEWLSAYIDRELDAEERAKIERHLLECESCQAVAAELMDMRSQVEDFYGRLEAPRELEQRVLKELDRRAAASALTKTSTAAVPLVGLAALLALIVVYGASFWKLFAIVFQFLLTAAYVASHVAASIPAVWGTVLALSAGIFALSGWSLRRMLRSTAP